MTELIDVGIEAAFITSPDDAHADIACELLEAGIAVYVEKPLAITLDSATKILETSYRTGSPATIGHR